MAVISDTQGNFQVDLIVDETSSDIITNTSTATWKLRLKTLSGTSYMYGTPTIIINISGKNAHTSSEYRRYDSITTEGITVTSGTVTGIEHNDDGTIKSNSISFQWTGSGFTPNDLYADGTYEATTIQRRSIIAATRTYVGEVSQLNITTYVEGFTHSISYSFGSLTGYILPDGSVSQTEYIMDNSYIGFPIPTTWYSEMLNTPIQDCTLTIKTYNGALQIGDEYETTFKVLVDETICAPQITANIDDDLNSAIKSITGFTTSNPILVKGYSIPEINWNATGQNGATITSVTINNNIVTTSPTSFILNTNGIVVTAIDSRGLSSEYIIPFTLVDYYKPLIELNISRVNDTSLYINTIFAGKWYSGTIGSTQNAISNIYWMYAEYGSNTWVSGGNLVANTDYKVLSNGTFYSGNSTEAGTIEIGPLPDYTKAYNIMLVVEDVITIGTIDANTIQFIPNGIPIINWEDDYVNVNGDIRQYGVSISNMFVYSTNEEVIGKWIDDKPLYRKTFEITGGLSNGTVTISHLINNVDVIHVNTPSPLKGRTV